VSNRRRRKRQTDGRQQSLAGATATRERNEIFLLQAQAETGGLTVEESGGALGGGAIRDVAILTAGMAYPAIGEPFEIDTIMLQQAADSINARPGGAKSRISHPELADGPWDGLTDGIFYLVGRCRNARIVGNQVRGDIHIGEYANAGPQGTVGTYLLRIAKRDPAAIGISIRFIRGEFVVQENQPPLGRLLAVTSVDFVGDPGGNPSGLLAGKGHDNTNKTGDGAGGETGGPEHSGESAMNETLRRYLESIGLKAGATEQEAVAFWKTRTGSQKEFADSLASSGKKDPAKDAGGTSPPAGGQTPAEGQTGLAAGTGQALGGQQPPAAGQISDEQRRQISAEALAADKTRRDGIIALAKANNLPETWAQGLAERGVSIAEAQRLVDLSQTMQPLAAGVGSIQVGQDRSTGVLREAMSDAICLRADVPLYQVDHHGRAVRTATGLTRREPHAEAVRYSHLSMVRMATILLSQAGVADVNLLGEGQILELALNPRALADRCGGQVALAMSTSDFPYILGDAMRKTIRALYADAEQEAVWPSWCGRVVLPDFRNMDLITVSEVPDLLLREEGQDVRYATVKDGREQMRVYNFSRGMRFTMQAMRNDTFGVFARQIRGFASATVRLLDRGSTAILVANAALADTYALFSTEHANLASGGDLGAPSVATLSAAKTAMRSQKGLRTAEDGDNGPAILNLRPRTILTPVALEDATRALVASEFDPAATQRVPNPLRNFAQVVGNPYLDDASITDGWFLAADPNGPGGGVQIGFLEGEEVPIIRSEVDFNTGDLKAVCEHKAGFKADNYRGLYYNPGS